MTAVTISGTFSKDERASNGLEDIADELIKDQLGRHYVVGVVQFSGASVPGPNEPLAPRVKFLAIEPLDGAEADNAKRILDAARKARGLGVVEETFDVPSLFDFDGDGAIRRGPDWDPSPQVPEPSAEELMAERAEARAAVADPFSPGGGDAA